jgi:nitrate/nitrite-specific signal transduction histidine kinase
MRRRRPTAEDDRPVVGKVVDRENQRSPIDDQAKPWDHVRMELEALSNMGRHSGATTCRVSILRAASAAVIEIDDDGRGFDADSASRGMGMVPL